MKISNLLLAGALLTFASCATKNKEVKETRDSMKIETGFENVPLEVKKWESSGDFSNVEVVLVSPDLSKPLKPGKTLFKFDVKNFEMGAQTPGAGTNGLANSDQGQHLHVIIDNQPYMAHYKPEVEIDLEEGWHTMVVFPSRSWHESVKAPKAGILKKFKVGNPKENDNTDITKPMLVYSRPKGKYKGGDGKKVLLDWYLFNCELSDSGYKVLATINAKPYTFTKWEPQVMTGFALGDNVVSLMLVDKEGNTVPGSYNDVRRNVEVE